MRSALLAGGVLFRKSLGTVPHALLACSLAGLASRGEALECAVESASPSWFADSVAFALKCDGPFAGKVAWEFGDDRFLDSAAGQLAVKHKYAAIGTYTVFARIEGLTFAAFAQHTVLHRPTPVRPTRSSTILFDAARSRVWCVNADNHSVTAMDARTFARLAEVPVGRRPRTLALDSLGRVWVANQDDATLTVLDGLTFTVLHTVALPRASRPFGICFDPRGGNAYVTLEATGMLVKIDAATRQASGSLDLFPTPRGIAVTHDGGRILVTRFQSPKDRGEVADVSASPFVLSGLLPLDYDTHVDNESNGAGVPNALSALAISPDGRRAWIPFKKDNVKRGLFVNPVFGPPTFQNTVRTGVAMLDLVSGREEYEARRDFDNRSMASAVAFDGKGAFAYAATLTSNHTVVFDNATGLDATAIEPTALDHELAPDGLVLGAGDSLLFIHYFMSREVAVHDVTRAGSSNEMPRLALVPTVAKDSLAPQVLLGKRIFYNAADPRMARDRYLACATCHLDGGSDGRVWDFTHKGEGLRRTTSLLGRSGMGHGPVHWTANFDEIQDFEHDIRGAFGGSGLMSDVDFNAGRETPLGGRKAGLSPELDALAAYVASLTKVNPSPFRNADGSMTPDAREGEAIFHSPESRCATCHAPPRFTDSELTPMNQDPGSGLKAMPGGFLLHDVGTLKPGSGKRLNDTLQGLDTPTLLGLWETGPYLHDGSAASVMEVLTTANAGDRHGKTSHLTPRQLDQLAAFLVQLDDASAHSGTGILKGPSSRAPGRFTFQRDGRGYRILWNLPEAAGRIRLRIFDAGGRRVTVLRPMAGRPGDPLSFHWSGEDSGGRPAASGIHLFRVDWDGGSRSQRAYLFPR